MPKYNSELEGQYDFYRTYLPLIDKKIKIDDVHELYTDGVVRGNLLEFKLNISDLNAVLFQSIKYLSTMRIKGRPIPKNILLLSLNTERAFLYDSNDYLEAIEEIYVGPSSKSNLGFVGQPPLQEIDYSTQLGQQAVIDLLRSSYYTRIHIDENCIVGWAEFYYRTFPHARKSDFIGDTSGKVKIIGEIREPDKFKEFIYPYEKDTNEKFAYLMDKLNDFLQKKDLGAFYTHPVYAEKSHELLRAAIQRVPEGNEYIIIDRCAGTGNLEETLTDEELSHVIVSTVEYYEYKVLVEKLGDKVLAIIPPTEKEDTYQLGRVRGADALSEEYINNSIIKKYVDDPKYTIILFENPPFADTTSIEHQKREDRAKSSLWRTSYVVQEMKKEVKGRATYDLGNAFIWSGFKYYLRQPSDSYVVYSPIKYWKAQSLINKHLVSAFAFNRRHFHTNIDACIVCALWGNEDDYSLEGFNAHAFDIDKSGALIDCGNIPIRKIHSQYSQVYFDKRKFPDDVEGGILCSKDGTERILGNKSFKPIYNDNIIGYMAVYSSGFDNPDNMASLLVAARYDGHGFYLRNDNLLEKMPMFCASRYVTYNKYWTERGRVMKSGDGSKKFYKNLNKAEVQEKLLKCLLFTCFEPQNHVRSFIGSDGKLYQNQICLDTHISETVVSRLLAQMNCNDAEKQMLQVWEQISNYAKTTKNYQSDWNYGLYQIKTELNTSRKDEASDETVYDYPELNGYIKSLAELLRKYYIAEIVPFLFEYDFLK